ncbi:major mite allergen Der p 23-like [Amphibalanus amphitrite]|uniref:major mite allergen Der p 23-like n=1 Tax=Amphibalanus amphitrite TaxID=1232801 RepID=UPI001C90E366|nr:major mite allergen Der p 23-like [Amphibalanus amphitrite]
MWKTLLLVIGALFVCVASGAKISATSPFPDFDCPSEYGWFPDPDDCHSFFECNYNYPFHFTCPDGLAWNDAAHQCDRDDSCK